MSLTQQIGQLITTATDLTDRVDDWLAEAAAALEVLKKGIPTVVAATDEAAAIAAGLQAGEMWLDTDGNPPTVYLYDGTASTPLTPQPEAVWSKNTQRLWLRGADGMFRPYSTGEPDWRSGQLAFVYGDVLTIPHPLGRTPRRLHFCYVCTTAVSQFQVGDRVWWGGVAPGETAADAEVVATSTHIYIDADQRYPLLPGPQGSSGHLDLSANYDKFAIEVEAWL